MIGKEASKFVANVAAQHVFVEAAEQLVFSLADGVCFAAELMNTHVPRASHVGRTQIADQVAPPHGKEDIKTARATYAINTRVSSRRTDFSLIVSSFYYNSKSLNSVVKKTSKID